MKPPPDAADVVRAPEHRSDERQEAGHCSSEAHLLSTSGHEKAQPLAVNDGSRKSLEGKQSARAPLLKGKSMAAWPAKSDDLEAAAPIAPPRHRKRQSVPINRFPAAASLQLAAAASEALVDNVESGTNELAANESRRATTEERSSLIDSGRDSADASERAKGAARLSAVGADCKLLMNSAGNSNRREGADEQRRGEEQKVGEAGELPGGLLPPKVKQHAAESSATLEPELQVAGRSSPSPNLNPNPSRESATNEIGNRTDDDDDNRTGNEIDRLSQAASCKALSSTAVDQKQRKQSKQLEQLAAAAKPPTIEVSLSDQQELAPPVPDTKRQQASAASSTAVLSTLFTKLMGKFASFLAAS